MGQGRGGRWGRMLAGVALLAGLGTCRYLMRDRPMVQVQGQRRDVSALAYLDGEGRRRTLAESRGRIVLLHHWNSGPGHRIGLLEELAALQGRQDGRYEVLPMLLDPRGRAGLVAFLAAHPGLWLECRLPAQLGSFVGPLGGVVYLPKTYVVDRRGGLREELGAAASRTLPTALADALQE